MPTRNALAAFVFGSITGALAFPAQGNSHSLQVAGMHESHPVGSMARYRVPSQAVAEGMNPHHNAGQSMSDPHHFKYHWSHMEHGTDKLVYYEYEAKRHKHVTFLESDILCSSDVRRDGNVTVTLLMSKPELRAANLHTGSILVSAKGGRCQLPDEAEAKLQDRIVTPPVMSRHSSGKTAVSFKVKPAQMHELFEDMTVEYYRGKPEGLRKGRADRAASLKKMGRDAHHPFTSTDGVLSEAKTKRTNAKRLAPPTHKVKVQRKADASRTPKKQTKRLVGKDGKVTTKENWYCYSHYAPSDLSIYSADLDVCNAPEFFEPSDYTDGHADLSCLIRVVDGAEFAMVPGGKYEFGFYKWTTYQASAKLYLYEIDSVSSNDLCGQLKTIGSDGQPTLSAFDEGAGNQYNYVTFVMPTWDELVANDCLDDGYGGGYPEFTVVMETADNTCSNCVANGCDEFDTYNAGLGEFRLVSETDKTFDEKKDLSFDKSDETEIGGVTVSYQVACTDCYVGLAGDAHVVVRTSNYFPFEEAWSQGTITFNGKVDFLAKLQATWETEKEWDVLSKQCIYPMCVDATLAGVGVKIGLRVGVAAALKVSFDATIELTFKREMEQIGEVGVHAVRTSGLSYDFYQYNHFDEPRDKEGSEPKDPGLAVTVDAMAMVVLNPVVDVGLWAQVGDWLGGHAAITLTTAIAGQVDLRVRWGAGSDKDHVIDALPEGGSCSAVSYDKEDASWGASCCASEGLPYCYNKGVCEEKHHTQIDLHFEVHAMANFELHAAADWGDWADSSEFTYTRYLTSDYSLSEDEQQFFQMHYHVASACFGDASSAQHSTNRRRHGSALPAPQPKRRRRDYGQMDEQRRRSVTYGLPSPLALMKP
jgi:hypothetical protein